MADAPLKVGPPGKNSGEITVSEFIKDQALEAMSLARDDPERFKALFANVRGYPPPDYRDTNRDQVIRKALSDYRADDKTQKITSAEALVSLALKEAELAGLTDEEKKIFIGAT